MPASLLQRAAVALVWLGLAVPMLFLVIRFAGHTAGWLTLMYGMVGIVTFGVLQLVLAILVAARADKVWPAAAGPVSAILMLVACAAHLLAALAFGDFGDTGPAAPSFLEQIFGISDNLSSGIGSALLLVWAVSHVAAIVFAAVEGGDSALAKAAGQATRL